MRIVRGLAVMGLLVASCTGSALAGTDGLVLRAVGWYQGKSSISGDGIKCEVPTVDTAISDGFFTMGLWNTYGEQTLQFPDQNHAFSDPCGGYVQLWNSMVKQGITLNRVQLQYRIGQWRRFSSLVSMKKGWPTACKTFKKATLFAGVRLGPNDPTVPPSNGSGLPNVAFIQVLPMISNSVFSCLREQFAPLPPDVYTDLPLITKARVKGYADNGDKFTSNVIKYTLNLRHVCGNGQVDAGEACDVTASGSQCSSFAICVGGTCIDDVGRACATDADCLGTCQPPGSVEECTCTF